MGLPTGACGAIQKRRRRLRIVIPTTGSRGDVQVYLALGIGLRAAGFDVRLVTHPDFESHIRARGLDFYPLPVASRAWHQSEDGRRMVACNGSPWKFISRFVRLRLPIMRELLAACFEGSQDADVVMPTSTSVLFGAAVAEKLNVPVIAAHLAPSTPSSDLPSCLMPEFPAWLPARRLFNRVSHLLVGEYFWQAMRKAFNAARTEVLGLPPFPFLGPPLEMFRDMPVVCSCSPLVVPTPRDWHADQQMTGYWYLPSANHWKPPTDLLDFLKAGKPPVCVGFGSMATGDVERFTDAVVQALELTGQRGILLTGWGGLSARPRSERLYVAQSIPHDWLYQRMTAVVHHAGAGTTAAAIRAGVPSVAVPFMADQPFWSRRMYRLGIAPKPIPRNKLTARRLASAIQETLADDAMRQRARQLGVQIRQEDGVDTAVRVVEDIVRQRLPYGATGQTRQAFIGVTNSR